MRDPLADPDDAIRRVYAYVAYRIGPGPEAEDVTSATIERALRYRNSYKREQGSATGWLIGIARRCLSDTLAARSQNVPIDDQTALASEDHAGTTAERLDLGHAVAQLDARARELIALRYGADLKSKEIARIVEMSPGAVDVAIHRALKELRGVLGEPERGASRRAVQPN